jgi:hypothetical protein
MIKKSRFIVTLRTSHLPMARGSPGVHISIHLMAETTESRTLCKLKKGSRDHEESNDAGEKENFYPLAVCLSPFLGLPEKIDPKGLD